MKKSEECEMYYPFRGTYCSVQCLPMHVGCLVELNESASQTAPCLFYHANLKDLYKCTACQERTRLHLFAVT